MKTTKQSQVIAYLRTVESAKKADIYRNVKFGYYCNWQHHLGELLSRMVNRGLIERVSKGVYKLSDKPNGRYNVEQPDPNQTNLFS